MNRAVEMEELPVIGQPGKTIKARVGLGYGYYIYRERERRPYLDVASYSLKRSRAEIQFEEALQSIGLPLGIAEQVTIDQYVKTKKAAADQGSLIHLERSSPLLMRGEVGLRARFVRVEGDRWPTELDEAPVSCTVNFYDLANRSDDKLPNINLNQEISKVELSWWRRFKARENGGGVLDFVIDIDSTKPDSDGVTRGYSKAAYYRTFGKHHSYKDMAQIFAKKALDIADNSMED